MGNATSSMKYTAYPEYKNSGVEWLGNIPAHWKVCRLKYLATIKNGSSRLSGEGRLDFQKKVF